MGFGWRTGSALGLGLVVALVIPAGCSAGNSMPTVAPSLPAPTRALVGWSQTVCEETTSVDGLRKEINSLNKDAANPDDATFVATDADFYLSSITDEVGKAVTDLKAVKATGIRTADGYLADVLKSLAGIQAQLPTPDASAAESLPDDQKVALARRIAAAIGNVKPEQPKLTAVAEGSPALAASYSLAPNCAPLTLPARPAAAAPSRVLVNWSDRMCSAAEIVAGLDADPLNRIPDDPRFENFQGPVLAQYITTAADEVGQIVDSIAQLRPTGVKEADQYRSNLLAAAQAALAKLPDEQGQDGADLDDAPVDQLKTQATQVAAVLATVKPQGPDLPTIVGHSRELTAGYDLAPSCTPLAPPSAPSSTAPTTARNGTDVAACNGGSCQIEVSAPVEITVAGTTFKASADANRVTILDDNGDIEIGAGGDGSFGQAGGKTVHVHVTSLASGTAILDITTS